MITVQIGVQHSDLSSVQIGVRTYDLPVMLLLIFPKSASVTSVSSTLSKNSSITSLDSFTSTYQKNLEL